MRRTSLFSSFHYFEQLFKQNKKRYEASVSDTPFDRVIRPNDVPGRLLNMALMNLGDDDPHLRLASYNLLDSLSTYFRFDMSSKLLQANGKMRPFGMRITNFLIFF